MSVGRGPSPALGAGESWSVAAVSPHSAELGSRPQVATLVKKKAFAGCAFEDFPVVLFFRHLSGPPSAVEGGLGDGAGGGAGGGDRPERLKGMPPPLRLGEHYDARHGAHASRVRNLGARTLQRAARSWLHSRRERTVEASARLIQWWVRTWLARVRRQTGVIDLRLHVFTTALRRSLAHVGRRRRATPPRTPHTPCRRSSNVATPTPPSGCVGSRSGRRWSAGDGASPAATAIGLPPCTPGPLLAAQHDRILERMRGVLCGWRAPELVCAMHCWRGGTARARARLGAAAHTRLAVAHSRQRSGFAALRLERALRCALESDARRRCALGLCLAVARWRLGVLRSGLLRRAVALAQRRLWVCAPPCARAVRAWCGVVSRTRQYGARLARATSAARAHDLARAWPAWRRAVASRRIARHLAGEGADAWQRRAMRVLLGIWRLWCRLRDALASQQNERYRMAAPLIARAATSASHAALCAWVSAAAHIRASQPAAQARMARVCRSRAATALRSWRERAERWAAERAVLRVGWTCHRLRASCRLLHSLRVAASSSRTDARLHTIADGMQVARKLGRFTRSTASARVGEQLTRCATAYERSSRLRRTFARLAGRAAQQQRSCALEKRAALSISHAQLRTQFRRWSMHRLPAIGQRWRRRRAPPPVPPRTAARMCAADSPPWPAKAARDGPHALNMKARTHATRRCRGELIRALSEWCRLGREAHVESAMRQLEHSLSRRRRRLAALKQWRGAAAWRGRADVACQRPPDWLTLRWSWGRWLRREEGCVDERACRLVSLLRGRALRRARRRWRQWSTAMDERSQALVVARRHHHLAVLCRWHRWSGQWSTAMDERSQALVVARRHHHLAVLCRWHRWSGQCGRSHDRALGAAHRIVLRRWHGCTERRRADRAFSASSRLAARRLHARAALDRWQRRAAAQLAHGLLSWRLWRTQLHCHAHPRFVIWACACARAMARAEHHRLIVRRAEHHTSTIRARRVLYRSLAAWRSQQRRASHAATSIHRALRSSLTAWWCTRRRGPSPADLSSRATTRSVLAALVLWHHAVWCKWGDAQLQRIGAAAARSLAAARHFHAWRAGAARRAERARHRAAGAAMIKADVAALWDEPAMRKAFAMVVGGAGSSGANSPWHVSPQKAHRMHRR